MNTNHDINPVALITGGAQRLGAAIAEYLHKAGYNIIIHYRHSREPAETLAQQLNSARSNSATCIVADLEKQNAILLLAEKSIAAWNRIDALINNASSFFPTPIGKTTEDNWNTLIDSNMKAPFFLAQALADALKKHSGCIINIADIYAETPLAQHTVYCMAKAGNVMLTKSLAREMAPQVRVNGIAPGAILWPKNVTPDQAIAQEKILEKIPLQRTGEAQDIAKTVLFLLRDAPYITGQIIKVDGGRSVHS